MKKLILPLLLLVAFGMLAAVESAPSDVVGYVKYDCVAGLNMVALPMATTWQWASEMADAQAGNVDAVFYWDAATQYWYGAADLGGFWDGDFEIANGDALWINALAPAAFYSIGDMPAQNATYNLLAGLNTMMVPLNKSNLGWASEVGMDIGTVDAAFYWDGPTQYWYGAADLGGFWDGDFEVSIGSPLWVNSSGATTWPTRTAMNTNLRTSK